MSVLLDVSDSGGLDDAVVEALLDLPPDAVVSDLTAASRHGLWLPPGTRITQVEACVPGAGRRPRSRPHTRVTTVRHRRRDLRPDEIVVVDGIPTTSIARTWLDLAERFSLRDLVAAGDCALRSGATREELDELIARAGHRRGVVRARQAVLMLDARSRSHPESCARVELVTAGLPKPDVNVPVTVDGDWIGEPDLSWKEARLGVEYQGAHRGEVEQMHSDITRGIDFAERDWLLIPAGPREIYRFPERFTTLVRYEYTRRRRTG